MKRKNVIIYMTPVPECWGNLKHFCEAKGISYNTFNRKPMPFEVNGYEVHKVPFLTGTIVPEAGGQNIKTE